MQRRVEQSDGDLLGIHCFEDLVEVAPLEVLDLAKILLAVPKDPVLDDGKAFGAEEHVLGSAETDTRRSMFCRLGRIAPRIRIGKDFHNILLFVTPTKNHSEIAAERRSFHLEGTSDAFTGTSIKAYYITGLKFLTRCLDLHDFFGLVHIELRCATDTRLTPTACNDGGMTGLATLGSENSGLQTIERYKWDAQARD
jgi:hypothetical protein